MTPEEALDLKGRATFLDVREQFEWDGGHLEDSQHIPMGDVPARLDEVDRDTQIVVICHLGQRSEMVAQWLRQQGYDAHNLDGGLEAWSRAGGGFSSPGMAP